MALPNSWLSRGDTTMFGAADWDWLKTQNTPETTAHQVLTKLRANQNVLHRLNRPGFSGRGIGGIHGLFDEIQGQAQSEHPAWNSTTGVNDWQYNTWGGVGFGRDDIEAARSRGASEYQIRQLHERAAREGVRTSGPHAQDVTANAPTSEWNYGAHGGWGFGMKDVHAVGDLERVKKYRDFAAQNRLNIGEGVNDWIMQQDEYNDRIANIPTAEEILAAIPTPKIRAGRDYATTGRSAQGMRIKRGTKFAEGGKRGTKGYFGRGSKFTGDTTPAMNIKGGGSGSTSQASNTLNTV